MSGAGTNRHDVEPGTARDGGPNAARNTGRKARPADGARPAGAASGAGAATAATVAAVDIARLARVGRAAVSNWRRRFTDFPEPVGGTAASPLFSLADVEAWFTRHGKELHVSLGDRIWQRVQATVDDLRLGELVGLLGAFLVFVSREPGQWSTLAERPDDVLAEELLPAIAAAVPELPGLPAVPGEPAPGEPAPEEGGALARTGGARVDPEWVAIIRAVADLAAEQGPAEALDFLCGRYLDAHSRRLPITPPPTAEFMAGLLGLVSAPEPGAPADQSGRDGLAGASVLDPACGVGNLLLAARAAGAVRLVGQEARDSWARLTLTRLLVAGADARVAVGDSLRADPLAGELVDAVLCDPPFNERSWGYDELTSDPRWEYGLPPRGESELAWAQHCLARVRPGGHVVVAMPAAAASRRPGKRIRGNLLRSGVLRAVVGLPAAAPTAPPAADLWVLRRPGRSGMDERTPSHVLVMESTSDLAVVRDAWRSFLADPEQPPPGPAVSVRIIDLLDDEIDISPRRHVFRAVEAESAVDYARQRARLVALFAGLADLPPALTPRNAGREPAMTTIGELVRAGAVSIHQAPLRMTLDGGDLPVLTAKDVRLGRPPSGRTTDQPGLFTVEPGDVVAPVIARDPVARVVTAGGAVLGPQLCCFRVDPQRIDPHFLAGFLRVARASGTARASTGSLRIDARKAPVPRLPLHEQREYGAAFRQLAEFEDLLREGTSLGAELVRLGFAGLAYGNLRP